MNLRMNNKQRIRNCPYQKVAIYKLLINWNLNSQSQIINSNRMKLKIKIKREKQAKIIQLILKIIKMIKLTLQILKLNRISITIPRNKIKIRQIIQIQHILGGKLVN